MSVPQQSIPSSPVIAQPIFLVDVNGNPLLSTNYQGPNGMSNLVPYAPGLYNGSTYDVQRGNLDGLSVMTVASGTTTQTSGDQTNVNFRGAYIIVNVTTLTGTSPTLTPKIQGKDPVSTQSFTLLLATAAIAATGTFVYLVYPNAAAGAQGVTQSAGFILPHTWNVVMTVGGTVTNEVYTVAASYLL